jgi:hypothetical protein
VKNDAEINAMGQTEEEREREEEIGAPNPTGY